MKIVFSKYHGAGNDFILIDDFAENFPADNNELIRGLCDRRFGIGADGLMLLRSSAALDFSMLYFNADGHEGSMCGNGGRCLAAFALERGYVSTQKDIIFSAVDGEHRAHFRGETIVCLQMRDVAKIQKKGHGFCVDTGSVHHVEYVDNLVDIDICRRGRALRRHPMYAPSGCNVNFIKMETDGSLSIRTYERGVENETLACGTGSVAARANRLQPSV
ncbi:MAG: diaminopimelate epimerase [FCB group bacterium]|nr:diaminopimelate epimerase [FCB group bacterium]